MRKKHTSRPDTRLILFLFTLIYSCTATSQNTAPVDKRLYDSYIGNFNPANAPKSLFDRYIDMTNNVSTSNTNFSVFAATAEETKETILIWHEIALELVADDHTPVGNNEAPLSQAGPTRASRALAMGQIAVFEAINAIENRFRNFTNNSGSRNRDASPDAAVVEAAFETYSRLYPESERDLQRIRSRELNRIRRFETDESRIQAGLRLGRDASSDIIANRRNDRSNVSDVRFGRGGRVANNGRRTFAGRDINGGSRRIGDWQPDPNALPSSGEFNLALGASWGNVEPFFLRRGDQFRSRPHPRITSAAYESSHRQVSRIGGAPSNSVIRSTSTANTRFIGNFWGYDGVPMLGVPPVIYNQIAVQVADDEIDNPAQLARFLAMVNVAMADAAIAAWDSKYFYNFWRPVTAIRTNDNNPDTTFDPSWNPVGISVINTDDAVRVTPPFPAYPSGHATFGGVVFALMRSFFGNNTRFTFVSQEFDGEGRDPFTNRRRPLMPVRFANFREAQRENGISRVYNGSHWSFDDTAGNEMGEDIADFLLNNVNAFSRR
ncbi:vanadium-dependent haloperoxidase [Agarilytica rhodophyticola]|uniref:vanadium-dependent haloperoxidase n=1 Tax=Agarilytica rhodophyticola TaxID=1737490 RepID=UPI000B341A91|nr:vanadium-dependent haloperoxidase [Agarilytica rhodophyticola]